MIAFALTQYHDHDPRVDTLMYGLGEDQRIKHLDSPHAVPDILAWCTENDCHAAPAYPRRDAARVYIIIPMTDDAAFALRIRWM